MKLLTVQEFGRGWYFKQARDWAPRRSRAIRLTSIRHIVPFLGDRPLATLKATQIRRWLRDRVTRASSVTVLFAAYTLRALLEAAHAKGHLSSAQWEELRACLSHGAVVALCRRRPVKGSGAPQEPPGGSAQLSLQSERVPEPYNHKQEM